MNTEMAHGVSLPDNLDMSLVQRFLGLRPALGSSRRGALHRLRCIRSEHLAALRIIDYRQRSLRWLSHSAPPRAKKITHYGKAQPRNGGLASFGNQMSCIEQAFAHTGD